MSISVSEAMQLNNVKALKLIAGKNGLDREIVKIGILDYELVEDGVHEGFNHGDFVLTTFTPIRDQIDEVKKTIVDLIDCGVAALAIKTIYIKSLPNDILEYANKKSFPIFIFNEETFFEDIIEDLMLGMESKSHIKILESKIDLLYKNELKTSIVEELAYDLNRNFLSDIQVFFLKEKRYINDTQITRIAEKYKRSRKQIKQHSLLKYRDGLLVIMSYKSNRLNHSLLDLDHLLNLVDVNLDDYMMGYSDQVTTISELHLAIKHSIYALKVCEMDQVDQVLYQDIGIFKLLLPHENSIWMKRYVDDILKPIRTYDDGKLIETAKVFVDYKGDVLKVSQHLYQHKNTIRYRIQKMKDLLNIKSDNEFYQEISIAIKCERLIR